MIGAITVGLIAAPLYAYLLNKENLKRDAELAHQNSLPEEKRTQYTFQELRSMGDNAPMFRYTI